MDWRSVEFLQNDFYNYFPCNKNKSTSRSAAFQDLEYVKYVKFQDLELFAVTAVRILEPWTLQWYIFLMAFLSWWPKLDESSSYHVKDRHFYSVKLNMLIRSLMWRALIQQSAKKATIKMSRVHGSSVLICQRSWLRILRLDKHIVVNYPCICLSNSFWLEK